MTLKGKELGQWGEKLAAKYLQDQGYKLLESNWRCQRGEIDLIFQAGSVLVFTEVKTRQGRAFGTPEEGVTRSKARKLLQLAQYYLMEKNLDDVEWRIDIVAVELNLEGQLERCEHIPNAVWAW